jgi:hypothetical protein
LRGLLSFLIRSGALLCVPGGVLWALSPIGVTLSEYRFDTPNVFWKLFASVPLLLLVGLVGLQVWQARRSGWLEKVGFLVALLGLILILAGDVAEFWLGVDDIYIMTAPAYRAFRMGLIIFAAGSILFGVAAPRDGALPTWGLLPFVLCSLLGLVAFLRDLGFLGMTLWMAFGVGSTWLGLSLLAARIASLALGRRANPGESAVRWRSRVRTTKGRILRPIQRCPN